MVFESLVAELLNKYLGDYVENLDKSQLNIGIWGGDVVLRNLELKASALDDLDLPIKVLSGHLGTLILKIPWKHIYTEPVEVVIEDLFAIAGPNAGQKYDEAKEEQATLDKKRKQLDRIEKQKIFDEAAGKDDKGKKNDSFAEKLATQIIKNLQVKVNRIHVRYEDFYTTPQRPYAIGVTLDSLTFQTVDEEGKPKSVKEVITKIYKTAKLENLAIYWNCNTQTFNKGAKESVFITMSETVPTKQRRVKHQYLIRPINCRVDLSLDTKPHLTSFQAPKLHMNLVLEEIGLQLSRTQYHDIMEMLESFERMVLADKYRKFRRFLPEKPSRKQLWRFAYTCMLDEVKRRKKMWCWTNIKRHRELMKIYKQAYKKKLEQAKKASEYMKVLEQCEKELDVFSLTLMRSQAEMEFARQQREKKAAGGIFSFLRKKPKPDDKGITDKFNDCMTPDEYSKLYQAIGYEEGELSTAGLPPDYVAYEMHYQLGGLSLNLNDTLDNKTRRILELEVRNVKSDVFMKPASENVRVAATMGSFNIHGLVHDSINPMIVKSLTDSGADLLDLEFELKPIDKSCDQSVRLIARPTEIVYDAMTINHVVDFFKPPEHVKLKQLSKAAVSRYRKLKEQSTAGLKDIVQHHKYTEVNVLVHSSYLLVPETGTYRPGETNLLVLDLGNLTVTSEKDPQAPKKYRAKAVMNKARKLGLLNETETQDESLTSIMEKAYDTFTFSLDQFQVLYAPKGRDWKEMRSRKFSPMHIIQPMGYSILLQKCMFLDPRLPNVKVAGKLPQVQVTISDQRIVEISQLVLSIALPETPSVEEETDSDSDYQSMDEMEDAQGIIHEEREELLAAEEAEETHKSKSKVIDNATNMCDLDLSFDIDEIEVRLQQVTMGKEITFVKLKLDAIGARVKVRSFDIIVESYLGGLYLQHLLYKVPDSMVEWLSNQSPRQKVMEKGAVINLINTPLDDSQGDRLLSVFFLKANSDNPEFNTTYKSTEQTLSVKFSHLEVMLHEDALLTLVAYLTGIADKISAIKPQSSEQPSENQMGRRRSSNLSDVVDYMGKQAAKSATKLIEPKKIEHEIQRMKIDAVMDTFDCTVCTDKTLLTDIKIQGLSTKILINDSQTEVNARLTNIEVFDPFPSTIYPKVLSIDGKEVFDFTLTLYNQATRGLSRYSNMSKVDTRVHLDIASIKYVFLYRYLDQLLKFINNFDQAKAKALDLSSAAGEKALETAQSVHEKATRVALAVTVKAPIVVIPSCSTSTSAVVVHLGTVSVHNNFMLTKDQNKNKDGYPAVLDAMNIELTELQIERSLLSKDNPLQSSKACKILEPVTLKADIIRNLAASWYRAVPEVDIKATLPKVKIDLSQDDFAAVMTIIHENLSEGFTVEDVEVAPPPKPAETPKTIKSPTADVPMMSLTPAEKIFTKINVAFSMNSLELVLYTGGVDFNAMVQDSEGRSKVNRNLGKSLARFAMSGLNGGYMMRSDNSMEASVSLMECNLDDTRPDYSQGITKMIERIHTGKSSSSDMIKVVFNQKSDLSKSVRVDLNKMFIIVSVPYLMAVSNFFIEGMPKVDNKQKIAVQQKTDEVSTEVTNETLSSAETVITLHVENPEIILVEDSMSAHTNALVLDAGVAFRMRLSAETMNLSAELKLEIISATYSVRDKSHRKIAQIMTPCSISFHGSAPGGKGMHMDLTLSDLDICVSPATIMTISKIATGLSQSQKAEETNAKSSTRSLWIIEKVAEMKAWYLNTSEFDDITPPTKPVETQERGEQMLISARRVILKLEGGTGNKTVPLLVAELTADGELKDWSTKMFMVMDVSIALSYFNEKNSVWEPFLEPADDGKKADPWTLGVELKQNDDYYPDLDEDDSESEIIGQQPPKMTLTVKSDDMMQICLSKAGLDMLSSLAKAFGDAYALVQPSLKPGEVFAPYSIRNATGTMLSVKVDKTLELMHESEVDMDDDAVNIPAGDVISLHRKKGLTRTQSVLKQAQEGQEIDLIVNMKEYGMAPRDVAIQKAVKKVIYVYRRQEAHALVIETTADLGRRQIIFRSDTEVLNCLEVDASIYHMNDQGEMLKLATIHPCERFYLPLHTVYGKNEAIFVQPEIEGVELSQQGVKIRSAASSPGTQLLTCPYNHNKYSFNIAIQSVHEKAYTESADELTGKCVQLILKCPLTFHNQLPYTVSITPQGQPAQTVIKGSTVSLNGCVPYNQKAEVRLCDYMDADWIYEGVLCQEEEPELTSWTFTMQGSTQRKLTMHVLRKVDGDAVGLTLTCPYWFINRTGLDLLYKDASAKDVEVLCHGAQYGKPFLFSYNKLQSSKEKKSSPLKRASTIRFRKDKASMRVKDSKWSDKFSLDTVGSQGTVVCKSEGFNYEIGVQITLASNGVTKMIELSPYFIAINQSLSTVTLTEEFTGGASVTVPPNDCLPFWPRNGNKVKQMRLGLSDATGYPSSSDSFLFSEAHSTLLKFNSGADEPEKHKRKEKHKSKHHKTSKSKDSSSSHKHKHKSALNVDVSISDLAVVIQVDDYRVGCEAARIVNCLSDTMVTFHQQGEEQVLCLAPGESCLYTWQKPIKKRVLLWSAGVEVEKQDELVRDAIGEFFADKESNHKCFWVSFLDGMQRVLLFTEDFSQAAKAQEAGEFERSDIEVVLSLEGAGLSVVDNEKRREIAYLGVTSSGVIWEEKKKRRWKAMNIKICEQLEEAAQRNEMLRAAGKPVNNTFTTENMEVDLVSMRQLKPNRRAIRRTFQPGVWLQYKSSLHKTMLHAKINRIQLDNQLPDAVYPVVFSPTPLPKSVAAESVPKPFIEASMVMRKHEHSDLQQIKYLKVLVQEMTVKADQGFINVLIPFFGGEEEKTPSQLSKEFSEDLSHLNVSLMDYSSGSANKGKKNFYDELHFSPLKIHLSFSITSGKSDGKVRIRSQVLRLFLQSVGVALTDIQDVVFRIAYFERKYVFYEQKCLVQQIQKHYTQQAIKQAYVLVLGLDVLGNPFGLVRGLAEGAKDLFYEPIQGAVQGPEEFAEGLGIGLRSLLSGTLGGAAGAVSRITGTLGKGLAALTLDDKYQRQRRENMNRQPANAAEGFARGVKGLGMGFFDGVTGIVRKPVEGAKEQGVEGFFKGLGKGLIGVVARPTGGIVDFASNSFEGIRKVTTLSSEVTRLRPPRVIRSDGVITPYNYRQAAGNSILQDVAHGKFIPTDEFRAHCVVTADSRCILLATDRRVMFIQKGDVFGQWDLDWFYEWKSLVEAPSLVEGHKIKLLIKQDEEKKGLSSLFGGKSARGKMIPIYDPKEAEWMMRKMVELYRYQKTKESSTPAK